MGEMWRSGGALNPSSSLPLPDIGEREAQPLAGTTPMRSFLESGTLITLALALSLEGEGILGCRLDTEMGRDS
jgi:hypothetical protein